MVENRSLYQGGTADCHVGYIRGCGRVAVSTERTQPKLPDAHFPPTSWHSKNVITFTFVLFSKGVHACFPFNAIQPVLFVQVEQKNIKNKHLQLFTYIVIKFFVQRSLVLYLFY